jgi:isochorismate synthase
MATVDRAWSALLAGALVDDARGDGNRGATGRGPLLVGGFSFAPEGPHSDTWRGFPGSHLVVPRLQLASTRGECWLTLSAIVSSDGEPDASPEELVRLCRSILTSSTADSDAPWTGSSGTALTYSSPMRAAEWRGLVEDATSAIRAGRLHKVVLARAVHGTAPRDLDVIAVLRHLRAAQPDCFVFGYWRGDRVFVGASPERLVRLDGRVVQASSLAGSAARGASVQEDDALAAALLASEKDRAEHGAVRDALRTGLADLCDDVVAPETPSLLTLRHVHHLHTPVSAVLRRGHSLLDVVARLHPTPAVGGTPRAAALEFIRRHERLDRGWYAAPIGWIGRDSGEFAVALRSAVIAGSDATLFAGCGIVAASEPDREFAESLVKLRPMQAALATAIAPTLVDSTPVAAAAERER